MHNHKGCSRGGMLFRLQTERGGKIGGDWFIGDVWLTNDHMADIGRWRLRKRLGARLFELADEHLPKSYTKLLHTWAGGASRRALEWRFRGMKKNSDGRSGWVTRHLGIVFDRIRRLADDDMECQLLVAALGMRVI